MDKCRFCGTQLPENTEFCSTCGAMTKKTKPSETKTIKISSTPASKAPHVGYLVWAVANIVVSGSFFFLGIPIASLVMSIIALIKTIQANDCHDEATKKSKLRTAKILNIISSSITAASIVILAMAIIIAVIAGDAIGDFMQYLYYYGFID